MKTIHHVLDIGAMRQAAFEAVNSDRGLSGWWSNAVSGDYVLAGVIRFTFAGDFNPHMKITALEQDKAITWQCIAGHEPWANGTFRFEFVDHEAGTRMRFWQDYAVELSDDAYGIYNYNWGYYLESLRLYLTTGAGKPYTPS